MHSLPFRQKFRLLTVMAAPAVKAQPQGPQVPRAQRPMGSSILQPNDLRKNQFKNQLCVPFFHTSLSLLTLFMCMCRHFLICPLLLHFAKYFVLALPPFTFICFSPPGLRYSLPCYQLFVPISISFQFFRHEKFFGLFVCFLMTDVIYCIPFTFCLVCLWLEKFYLLLPRSRCNSLHCSYLAFLQLALRFGFAGIQFINLFCSSLLAFYRIVIHFL